MFKKFLSRSTPNGAREPALSPVSATHAPRPEAQPAGYRRIDLEYPIHPRPRSLKYGPAGERLMATLAASVPAATELVRQVTRFHPQFLAIEKEPRPEADPAAPTWVNGWFPAFDAVMLYGLLALRNPRHYVEVGSGNSTRFARRAIRDHGLRTRIISIDPCPRAEIDALCDQVVRSPLEEVEFQSADQITAEDLLFVDSSHRSFQNSDVTVFFTEILPALPPGLVYGMHDIYLPNDYPPEWEQRFYSEQYLLATYLAAGADGDEVLAPLAYLFHETQLLKEFALTFDPKGLTEAERYGNSFWMKKGRR